MGTHLHSEKLILPNFSIPRVPTVSVPIPEVRNRIGTEGGLTFPRQGGSTLCAKTYLPFQCLHHHHLQRFLIILLLLLQILLLFLLLLLLFLLVPRVRDWPPLIITDSPAAPLLLKENQQTIGNLEMRTQLETSVKQLEVFHISSRNMYIIGLGVFTLQTPKSKIMTSPLVFQCNI